MPASWTLSTLGQLVASMSNGMPGVQNKEGRGIPVSRIETIADQTVNFSRIGYMEEYEQASLPRFQLRSGDILFSHINSPAHIGKTAIFSSDKTLFHGINLLRIQVNQNVCEPRFFNYACKLLRANGEFSLNAQHAVNQSSLNQKKIAAFPIPLAPRPEQQRIADKLDTILTRVEAANNRLTLVASTLRRFRQSVLFAATSGRLTKEWRRPSYSIAHDIPEGWSRHALKHIGKISTGLTPKKSQTIFYGGNIPFVKPGDLDKGTIFSTDETLTLAGYAEARTVRAGAVFVSCIGNLGKVGLAGAPMAFNQQINAIEFHQDYVLDKFGYYSCMTLGDWLKANSSATTIAIVNKGRFEQAEINIPPLLEQKEIVRRVETLFAFADRLEARLQAAQIATGHLTPALLAKAFRGELVPQDPNDEPASKLLSQLTADSPGDKPKRGRKAAV